MELKYTKTSGRPDSSEHAGKRAQHFTRTSYGDRGGGKDERAKEMKRMGR
jgi:hypothetical protein